MPPENELEDDSVVISVPETEDDGSEEIKVDDGSVDSSEEDSQVAKTAKKRKRGNNGEKVIKEQWKKIQDAQRRLQETENRLEAEAERAKTFEGITENALTGQFQAARELAMMKLRDAKAREDIEAETKYMAEISELDAQSAQLKRYKIENETRKPAEKEARGEPEQEPVVGFDAFYEKSPPATRKFMDENKDWLDPNSDNYDEEKTQDIIAFGANLERELAAQGRGAEIGTVAYYKKLNKYIKENWDEEMEDESTEEAPIKKTFGKQQTAAPVNGRGTGATVPKSGSVRLSKSEVDFALSMPLKHPNGREYTDDEKLKAHSLSKRNTPESGAITVNSRRR